MKSLPPPDDEAGRDETGSEETGSGSCRELVERLARAVARSPVTVLSGPPGSGKTALAAAWVRTQEDRQPTAWLTVGTEHDDPATFWRSVLAALGRAGVELRSIERPVPGAHLPASFTIRLAARLADLPRPIVLVLDGADRLTRRETAEALDLLTRNVGGRLRLVLCTQDGPPPPLGRSHPR